MVLWLQDSAKLIIESALDWISLTSFQTVLWRKRLINLGKLKKKKTTIIISENWTQICLTVHFTMKVLYWRINVHENVIATFNYQLWSQNIVRRYSEKTVDLVCLQNIQWSRVHADDAYQSVTYYSPVAQTWISSKRNGRSIDELICSDRDWKQTDWTQLLPCHWYSQELICIRKTKFHNKSVYIYIYRLRTRTED